LHHLGQGLGPVGAKRRGRQAGGEALPGVRVGSVADRVARKLAELVVGALSPGGADDAKALGHEPRGVEVEEPGQELAFREVAEGAE